jgi:hypothetical protein
MNNVEVAFGGAVLIGLLIWIGIEVFKAFLGV